MPHSGCTQIPIVIMCALASVATVNAHGTVHEQIEMLNAELRTKPSSPELLLLRAEAWRIDENWAAATADVDAAVRAGAALGPVALSRARIAVARGDWAAAAAEIAAMEKELPEHTGAWRLMAGIHAAQGAHDAAATAMRAAIRLSQPPQPDDFIQLAAALAARGDKAAAVVALDEGILALGNVPGMAEAAASLEIDLGRTDAGLARYDRIATGNAAFWLAKKAGAADRAGRGDAATAARKAALAAIESMPDFRRYTVAISALEKQLRASTTLTIEPASN